MPKTTKLEHEEHIAAAEEAIVKLRSYYRAEQYLSKKYGVDERSARRWIKHVRDRWKREGKTDADRLTKRVEIRTLLNEVIQMAFNRTHVVKNADGTVVLDPSGRPVVRANPDLQRVLHASKQLRDLDGLDEPLKVEHSGSVATGVLIVPPREPDPEDA